MVIDQNVIETIHKMRQPEAMENRYQKIFDFNQGLNWGLDLSSMKKSVDGQDYSSETEIFFPTVHLPNGVTIAGPQRTFEAMWHLTEDPLSFKKERHQTVKDHTSIILLDELQRTHKPGHVGWVGIDFFANINSSPASCWDYPFDARTGSYLGYHEIMTACAVDKYLVGLIDADFFPVPRLSGFKVAGVGQRDCTPYLYRLRSHLKLHLGSFFADTPISKWACPIVRPINI